MELIQHSRVETTIQTGEDTLTFKNAYLIIGTKPCYAAKSKRPFIGA